MLGIAGYGGVVRDDEEASDESVAEGEEGGGISVEVTGGVGGMTAIFYRFWHRCTIFAFDKGSRF